MTFNWEEIWKDGLIELHCFHTQHNKTSNKTRRVMSAFFSLPEEVEAAKKTFEQNRRCVVEDGAWKPIENAVWTFRDNQWTIDESQIMAVT